MVIFSCNINWLENVLKCLNAAKPLLNEYKMNLVVEPLNNIDRVGYSMPYAKPVFELLRNVASPNIKMLYDNGVDTTQLLANKINHPVRAMHKLFAGMLVNTMFEN